MAGVVAIQNNLFNAGWFLVRERRPRPESQGDYGAGVFTRADFVGLAARPAQIAGKFILSVNDVPDTREIFRRFAIETVATRYTFLANGPT